MTKQYSSYCDLALLHIIYHNSNTYWCKFLTVRLKRSRTASVFFVTLGNIQHLGDSQSTFIE